MIDPAPYDLVASRLDRVVGPRESSRAACPLQCSRSRKLSIREQPDGGVLLHCFALHCEVRAIVSALGLELRDLIAPSKRRRSAQTKHERVEAAIERSWEATIAGTAPSHVIESALAAATKANCNASASASATSRRCLRDSSIALAVRLESDSRERLRRYRHSRGSDASPIRLIPSGQCCSSGAGSKAGSSPWTRFRRHRLIDTWTLERRGSSSRSRRKIVRRKNCTGSHPLELTVRKIGLQSAAQIRNRERFRRREAAG